MRKKPNRKPEPVRATPAYLWPAALVLAVLTFYWTPLTSSTASIQWDAVDVHYSSQKYFADHVMTGSLPYWTPYLYSGFPFLADPQVGAFYPLNWPFFLIGVTPSAIEMELALHALLACAGAFFLGKKLFGSPTAALAVAFFYGFSGYFAAHSSHVGIFQTAAWLPWLLYGFLKSVETPGLKPVSLTGLAAGSMILAGHFQTTLYAFCALALCAAVQFVLEPERRVRVAAVLAAIVFSGALLSAIQTLPGVELVRESIRAGIDTSTSRDGVLPPGALLTLISPDHLGAPGGQQTYKGPPDITQHYFYAGLLMLPFAIAGLLDHRVRWLAAALIVPCVWYALGPDGGFYRLIALLPAFSSVRAPVHVWFVVALGFALLGGAGFDWVNKRFPHPALAAIALAIVFVDLYYWNSANNKLAYAHDSYDNLYGAGEQRFQQLVAATQPPLTRFHAPSGLTAFGSMNHSLDTKLEATYGYNPLELKRYADYLNAAQSNRAMLDDLAVTRILNVQLGGFEPNPSARPFAVFSKGGGTADVTYHDEQRYRIRYHADAESQLRVAVAWFPGWRAVSASVELHVEPTNGALLGITVPAGEGELDLRFQSNYFTAGAIVSSAAALALLALAFRRSGLPRSAPASADSAAS